MVVTFAITMRCFQKMNGKLTVSWIFGWFAVVNDRMSALEGHTVESISTTAIFTIQTWGYHLFVWKQCLFFGHFQDFSLLRLHLWRDWRWPNDSNPLFLCMCDTYVLTYLVFLYDSRPGLRTFWITSLCFGYDTVSDVVECKVHQCQQNSDA